jgi:hypothetical protein
MPGRRFPTPVQTGSGSTGTSQRSEGNRAPSDGRTLAQAGTPAAATERAQLGNRKKPKPAGAKPLTRRA